jgi:hypothetical protein
VASAVKAQDATALEEQYSTCARHYIPADKCTPEIYAQLKAKDNAPLSPEADLGLTAAKIVQAQLLNPASFQVRKVAVLTGNYSRDGGPYVCVVYGGQAVAGGLVVNSKSFHEKPDKKHPDKPSKLGETLLNYCDTIGRVSGWKDVTNEVQVALGRQ